MAQALAVLSAFFFALAATLQQKGGFRLAEEGRPVTGAGSLLRLIAVPLWLLGTLVLLVGYGTQGIALDKGPLNVVQPLLVLTIAFALPLGHWLTGQFVTRRQVWGALVVIVGLAMFVRIGDPDAGVSSASNEDYLLASLAVGALAVAAILYGRRRPPTLKAAGFGVAAGLLFGLSAVFTKPTIDQLPHGVDYVLSHPEVYGLLGFGVIAFAIQQLALATGQLAPAVAATSVSNPFISVILGALIYEEKLTRPGWHVLLAALALLTAFVGAILITMGNREREVPTDAHPPASLPDRAHKSRRGRCP